MRGYGDSIDADINPLLQRNQGRILADGWTVGAEALVDVGLGSHVAGQLQPRAWIGRARTENAEADRTLLSGYVRGVFGNLAVDLGRVGVAHGQGRAYGPVFSSNPRGFDRLRIGMERPAQLPSLFRHLGPARFAAWVADMGRNQDTPGSKLFVYEGAIQPHPRLELGFVLLNHQRGDGAPEATWPQRLRDLLFLENRRFLPFDSPGEISDKVMALNASVLIPAVGAHAYVEMMTTDDHNFFNNASTGLWHNAAWTGGVRASGLGRTGRTDLWLQASRAGAIAYTHHQFTSGMTLDRRILGSALGPLGTGWEAGFTWTGSADVFELTGAWERYAGDTYTQQGRIRVRTADNPDEIRVRTTLDWTRRPALTGLRTTMRLGYEHVTRFDFTDQDRNNFLAQVGVAYVW